MPTLAGMQLFSYPFDFFVVGTKVKEADGEETNGMGILTQNFMNGALYGKQV